MKELIAFAFSLFDSAAVLVLTISTFGISLKNNMKKLLILIPLFTLASTTLVHVGLHTYSIFFLLGLLMLTFRYVFKENWKFSILISVAGTIALMMIQGFIAYTAMVSGLMVQDDLQPYTTKGYVAQTLTFGIVLVVSLYQRKFGEYFYFDFDNVFRKKKNIASARPYVLISTTLGIIFAFIYPNFYNSTLNATFYVTLTLTVIFFAVLLFLSFLRNKVERIAAE